jgi:hypothetical protein
MAAHMRGIFWSCSVLLVVASSLLILPSTASGEPRAHDGGFFLRLSGGAGYATSSVDADTGGAVLNFKFSGVGGDMNFAIGGIVTENLALHGTLWGWVVSEPDLEVGNLKGEISEDLQLTAVGGGVTYYFMPVNIYLSGSAGAAWLSLEDAETDVGFALDLTLGKEWWVGNRWGLGFAGAFGYHSVPDGDIDQNWTGTSFGIRFTATMN